MREGTRVQTKTSNEVGVIKTIIGNVAIVKYAHETKKLMLASLIEAENTATQTEFMNTHQDMLSDESIQTFFEDKLNEDDMVYHRAILLAFGVEMFEKLFNKNES